MAVGMAMAENHLAAQYNQPGFNIMDHYTYVISGDGDLMEGVSHESASLAGHLKLGKLIVLYDDNNISLDGPTSMAFTENVSERFEATTGRFSTWLTAIIWRKLTLRLKRRRPTRTSQR